MWHFHNLLDMGRLEGQEDSNKFGNSSGDEKEFRWKDMDIGNNEDQDSEDDSGKPLPKSLTQTK